MFKYIEYQNHISKTMLLENHVRPSPSVIFFLYSTKWSTTPNLIKTGDVDCFTDKKRVPTLLKKVQQHQIKDKLDCPGGI